MSLILQDPTLFCISPDIFSADPGDDDDTSDDEGDDWDGGDDDGSSYPDPS